MFLTVGRTRENPYITKGLTGPLTVCYLCFYVQFVFLCTALAATQASFRVASSVEINQET